MICGDHGDLYCVNIDFFFLFEQSVKSSQKLTSRPRVSGGR